MADINTHEIPSGGWQWFEPQTGWKLPTPISSTFDQSVSLIIRHRLSNTAMVVKHRLPTDAATVGGQLLAYTRKRLGIVEPPKQSPSQWFNGRHVAAVASGFQTLANWLGDGGKPVDQELAEKRAAICADCPQNPPDGGGWLATFTIPAQNLIRRQLQERKELKLSTSLDSKLNLCEACDCPLHLKVHVPLNYILTHIPEAAKERLDPRCWILHGT